MTSQFSLTPMRNLFIRVDGSSDIGLGHFVRCIALGQVVRPLYRITIVSKVLPEPCLREIEGNGFYFQRIENEATFFKKLDRNDTVVIDGYHFDTDYERSVKDRGCKLITIDDLFNRHFVSDCVINHGMGINDQDYSSEPYTKICHGTEYLMVRSNFYDATLKDRQFDVIKNLYINMGGSDPENIGYQILEKIDTAKFDSIHIVVGAASTGLDAINELIRSGGFKNLHVHYNLNQYEMQAVMEKCELALCTPSGISYELCCVGIGLIVCKTAANQTYFFKAFTEKGLALGVDSAEEGYVEELLKKCDELTTDLSKITTQLNIQREYFSAYSRAKILGILAT